MKTYKVIWTQWQQAEVTQEQVDDYLQENPHRIDASMAQICRAIAIDDGDYEDIGFEPEDACQILDEERGYSL